MIDGFTHHNAQQELGFCVIMNIDHHGTVVKVGVVQCPVILYANMYMYTQ